jgi:hypothetical protein
MFKRFVVMSILSGVALLGICACVPRPTMDDDVSPADDDDDNDNDASLADDDNDFSPSDDDDNDDNVDDDFVWTPMSGDFQYLEGVWGTSHTDVTAVGGDIIHFDGTSWSSMKCDASSCGGNTVWGISDSDIFATVSSPLGANGPILHYDGSSWSPSDAPIIPFLGIWGSSSSEVYAVGWAYSPPNQGAGWIFRYNGSTWAPVFLSSTILPDSVWGSSRDDVYVGTAEGAILHGSSLFWQQVASVDGYVIGAIWGSSSSDVFAVGSGGNGTVGCVVHYDGAAWTLMNEGHFMALLSVWGSSHTDVFAVGCSQTDSSGTIIHYNGASWSTMAGGPFPCLGGIWGSGPGDVFAVGGDTIYHYGPPE